MFYKKSVEETLELCGSSAEGISAESAQKSLEKYGKNALKEKKSDGPLITFLKQFRDLLVIILIIAAVVSGVSGQLESTIVISAVIVINAILGTVQTLKAEKSLEGLKKLSVPKVKVLRDGVLCEIPSTELCVGDIVSVEAGDIISGDGRVILSASLSVNESALTGEVESIEKNIKFY